MEYIVDGTMKGSSIRSINNNRHHEEGELIFCKSENECYNNESWDHCHQGEWIQLYMRLGRYPQEACKVTQQEKWSILHQSCSNNNAPYGVGRRTNNDNKSSSMNHNHHHDEELALPMVLHAIHFACPSLCMLQDSQNGEAPLHCAIRPEEELGYTIDDVGEETSDVQQKPQDERLINVIQTVLQMSLDEEILDDDDDDGEEDEIGVVSDEEVTTDDAEDVCACSSTVSDKTTTTNNSDESPTPIRSITSLQNYAGDTPFHKACRVGSSLEVLRTIMDNTPETSLTQPDIKGMFPLQRLWARIEHRSVNRGLNFMSRLEKVSKWDDLEQDVEMHATWEKSALILRKLYTGRSVPDTAHTQRGENDVGSPLLDFPILHAIASSDSPGDLMKLAITLFPEERVFTDAQGNNPLADIILARLPSYREGSLGYKHLRDVFAVLREPEGLGALYQQHLEHNPLSSKSTRGSSAAVLRDHDAVFLGDGDNSLHAAISSGTGWAKDLEHPSLQTPDNKINERLASTFILFPFILDTSATTTLSNTHQSDEDINGLVSELLQTDPHVIDSGSERKRKAATLNNSNTEGRFKKQA